jgi:putative FmdB family regulatory protein
MATYTYECNKCNERFEATQSVHDDPLTDCELCKKKKCIKRVIVPGTSFRIGGAGVHKPTSMYNKSDDINFRRN